MCTEPWVSVEDVANDLSVAKDYRWIEHRRLPAHKVRLLCKFKLEHRGLPAHKVGRLWKFKFSEVDEWVRAGGATEDGKKEPAR